MDNDFSNEIKKLNNLYSEIVEAITYKPDTADYEKSRIYFENVAARMNNWALMINELKRDLEGREPQKDLTADNRPA